MNGKVMIYNILIHNMYQHQEWTPVVLKSKHSAQIKQQKNNVEKTNQLKNNAGKNNQTEKVNSASIERKLESGELTIQKTSRELQLQIQQARAQKGITQKQLATLSNLPENVIKEYENGKAVPKPNELMKMSKVLGVTLKK